MGKGVLVDLTKCIGCGSCTVACKLWNDHEFEDNVQAHGENPVLNDKTWTTVTYNKVEKDNEPVWRFVKEQCMHCEHPACVSACFAKAFEKTPEGAVVYHPELCVGCRYCMIACPFGIPKYEWKETFPKVSKCQMCYTKIKNGEQPACVSVCPTGALKFGERDELLAEAKNIIANDNKYIRHIYGEKEVGGTAWLYISDVPFEELGFRTNVPEIPLQTYSHDYLKWSPGVFIGGGALLTALHFYTKRRNDISNEKSKDDSIDA